jgi:hypothetical protein
MHESAFTFLYFGKQISKMARLYYDRIGLAFYIRQILILCLLKVSIQPIIVTSTFLALECELKPRPYLPSEVVWRARERRRRVGYREEW